MSSLMDAPVPPLSSTLPPSAPSSTNSNISTTSTTSTTTSSSSNSQSNGNTNTTGILKRKSVTLALNTNAGLAATTASLNSLSNGNNTNGSNHNNDTNGSVNNKTSSSSVSPLEQQQQQLSPTISTNNSNNNSSNNIPQLLTASSFQNLLNGKVTSPPPIVTASTQRQNSSNSLGANGNRNSNSNTNNTNNNNNNNNANDITTSSSTSSNGSNGSSNGRNSPAARIKGGLKRSLSSSVLYVKQVSKSFKPPLSHKQRLTLSPWTKCFKFKRFPFKLILNILVTALMTTRVILDNNNFSNYVANQHETFHQYFRPDPDQWTSFLFSMDDVKAHLQTSVINYGLLVNDSISHYSAMDSDTGHPYPIELTVTSYVLNDPFNSSANLNLDKVVSVYLLNESYPLGPLADLNDTTQRPFFDNLLTMSLKLKMDSWQIGSVLGLLKFRWRCEIVYDLSNGGGVAGVSVITSKLVANSSLGPFYSIDVLIILFATMSIILTAKAIYKSFQVFFFAKARLVAREFTAPLDEFDITWSRLTLSDKLTFFNLWYIPTTLGDILSLAATAYAMRADAESYTTSTDSVDPGDLTSALGIFFCWVNLIKYLEWRIEFYVLILAVRCSISRIARFIIAALPVFIGYALAGVTLFSDVSDKFGSIDVASATLFAVINGDSVLEVFTTLSEKSDTTYKVVSRIYMYSFCVLFITAIINVFIFIIEDGYRLASTVDGLSTSQKLVIDNVRLREILNAAHATDPDVPTAFSRSINRDSSNNDDNDDDNDISHMNINSGNNDDSGKGGMYVSGGLDELLIPGSSIDDLDFTSNRSHTSLFSIMTHQNVNHDDSETGLLLPQSNRSSISAAGNNVTNINTTTAVNSNGNGGATTNRRKPPVGFGSLERMYSTDTLFGNTSILTPNPAVANNSHANHPSSSISMVPATEMGRSQGSSSSSSSSSTSSSGKKGKSFDNKLADLMSKSQELINKEMIVLQNEYNLKLKNLQEYHMTQLERDISALVSSYRRTPATTTQ